MLCNQDRIEKVIEFAKAKLDLAEIATGAGDELGLGRGFEQHSCLDYVLQELHRFPGRGVELIEAGLKSPVVRNRNLAVAALAGWTREEWECGLEKSLDLAARTEPNQNVRERMQRVLEGEPLSP